MSTYYYCNHEIYTRRGGFRVCGKPAVVNHGFYWYCREHDPERPQQMTLSEQLMDLPACASDARDSERGADAVLEDLRK